MEKLSRADVIEVLSSAAQVMEQLVGERDTALQKLAAYERRMDAEKVASAMIQKGITSEPFDRVVDQMEKAADKGELDVIRRSVEYYGPDMGEKVARVANDDSVTQASVASESDLFRFIVGDVG